MKNKNEQDESFCVQGTLQPRLERRRTHVRHTQGSQESVIPRAQEAGATLLSRLSECLGPLGNGCV